MIRTQGAYINIPFGVLTFPSLRGPEKMPAVRQELRKALPDLPFRGVEASCRCYATIVQFNPFDRFARVSITDEDHSGLIPGRVGTGGNVAEDLRHSAREVS